MRGSGRTTARQVACAGRRRIRRLAQMESSRTSVFRCHHVATQQGSAWVSEEPDGTGAGSTKREGLQDGAAPRLSFPLPRVQSLSRLRGLPISFTSAAATNDAAVAGQAAHASGGAAGIARSGLRLSPIRQVVRWTDELIGRIAAYCMSRRAPTLATCWISIVARPQAGWHWSC
jgi:hypothetical protein